MTQPNIKRKGNPVLVGCLVTVAVVLVAGGAAAYYFLGRPALAAFNAARDLGRIQQIENRINDRSSFSPPSNGLLTPQQVERYLTVSRQTYSRLENRVEVLDERYRDINRSGATFTGFRQAASAWADLLRLVVEAKETQVNALNANGFSAAEYSWVRSQVLTAAGVSFFEVDLAQLVADGSNPTRQQQASQVPQANVDLVAPYTQELEKLVPLAVFGL
ncbi:MAG: hypothetical protein KF813_03055 [Trueperaceae bacterium]|nr:hypothetical protein [Trueperaceae bacterium]